MSRLFLRTLRDAPGDAEVASHQLLVRAGYVRRVASGIWSWLPLGKIVLDRVSGVVREEMDRIGGQEVLLPALVPKEPYATTGRWDEYGDLLFRLKDRKGGDYLLGPTHEELFTLMVKGEYSSYKDLPVILYQVQTKYRDEARPRSGILRGREFIMKDAYSFDLDEAGLVKSYELHREAYVRIFDRIGLDYRIVSAVSGAMGGSASEEFLAPTAAGEDTFVSCANCGYAANVEAVTFTPPGGGDAADAPAMQEVHTPNTPTIESLAAHLGVEAAQTLKNVLVKIDGQPVAVGVPGDRDLDLDKLEAAVAPSVVTAFEADDFKAHPELVRGYVGPQHGLVTYYADPRVHVGTSWVTGANKPDHHVLHVTAGRDFTVERYLDVATIAEGDPCPRCGHELTIGRAIEIGHIFQLGRKYTDAFELDVLGPEGTPVRVTMGSYGIGVSRAVASIIEQSHDERGLIWPAAVAPADVHVVAVGKAGQREAAEQLGESLERAGLRVLLDDRGASAGVAFADADLIGVPTIVVVGKGLASGEIEIKDRRSGERRTVPLAGAVAELAGLGSPPAEVAAATPAVQALARAGTSFTLHEYDSHAGEGSGYGEQAAAALGVDPARLFKTLVVEAAGRLFVGVVPVAGMLDLKAMAAAVKEKSVRMAETAAAERATGYVAGGISPLGQRKRLTTVVDDSATGWSTVLVSAGRRGLQVELAPADLVQLTGASLASIGKAV